MNDIITYHNDSQALRDLPNRASQQAGISGITLDDPLVLNQEFGFGRILYCLDISGSMSWAFGMEMAKIKALCRVTISALGLIIRQSPSFDVALMSFDSQPTLLHDFVNIEDGYQKLVDSIQSLDADGGTDIPCALDAAYNLFRRTPLNGENCLIFMTDGQGGDGTAAAEKIKQLGAEIVAGTEIKIDGQFVKDGWTEKNFRPSEK